MGPHDDEESMATFEGAFPGQHDPITPYPSSAVYPAMQQKGAKGTRGKPADDHDT